MRLVLAIGIALSPWRVAAPAWRAAAAGSGRGVCVRRGLRDDGRGRDGRRPERRRRRRDVGAGPVRRRALVRRHERLRRPARLSARSTTAGFTLEAWVQKATDEERRRRSSARGPGRPDALGRPSRVAPSPHARQQPLHVSRFGAQSGARAVAAPRGHVRRHDGALLRRRGRGGEPAFSGSVGSSNTWRIGAYGAGPGRILRRARRRGSRLRPRARRRRDRRRPRSAARSRRPRRADDAGEPRRHRRARRRRSRSRGPRRRTTSASPATRSTPAASRSARRPERPSPSRTSRARTATSSTSRRSTAPGTPRRARTSTDRPPPASVAPGLVAAYGFDEGSGSVADDASGDGRNGSSPARRGPRAQRLGGLLARRRRRSRQPRRPRHVLHGRLHARGLGAQEHDEEGRRGRRHLGRQRPDALGRPSGGAPSAHARQQPLDVPRFGRQPRVGAWQHVAATFDGATARYYVDGVAGGLAGGLGIRRQLEHVADRRVRRAPRAASSTASSTTFASTTARSARARSSSTATTASSRCRCRRTRSPPSAPGTLTATGAVRAGQPQLGRGHRQRLRHQLQRPPLHERRLHAERGATGSPQPTGTTFADAGLAAGAPTTTRSPPRTPRATSAPRRTRRPASVSDTTAPSAPGTLTATGGFGQASLSWGAATDNIGVARYNVHRSTTSGFTPSSGEPDRAADGHELTRTRRLAAGTYYYKVTAEDAAGNVGPVSNQASAVVTADTTLPTVSITAPAGGVDRLRASRRSARTRATTSPWSASSSESTASTSAPRTPRAPYSLDWNTRAALNGSHSLTAVARDTSGNTRTSTAVA